MSLETKFLTRRPTRARGVRNVRRVRRQVVSLRRRSPRPWGEERLVDCFVADAHRLVIREVQDRAPGDLFRAPRSGLPSILSRAVPTSFPQHSRPPDRVATTGTHNASKPLLHKGA